MLSKKRDALIFQWFDDTLTIFFYFWKLSINKLNGSTQLVYYVQYICLCSYLMYTFLLYIYIIFYLLSSHFFNTKFTLLRTNFSECMLNCQWWLYWWQWNPLQSLLYPLDHSNKVVLGTHYHQVPQCLKRSTLSKKSLYIIKALNRGCSSCCCCCSYSVTNFASDCDWLIDIMWLHSKHIIGP